jgi:thiol-disulfide isomerase/thioredoxin
MASWCGNCRLMKPKFKKLASENENTVFVLADAEKFPESRKLATVDNLPTFATFKGGNFVNQIQTNKFENLKELVDEVTSY